jgi:pimeloyl-ACP methyl ester carboxylesterase
MSHTTPHFITLSGHSIHYAFLHKQWLKKGTPLLVFLHEGLGSIRQWKEFPALLAERTNCPALLYDRYGYGLSDARKGTIHTGFLHDEAIRSLPELFWRLELTDHPKILIGHSDGGTIALIHAGAQPDNILGVISEAAHVLVEEATLNGILQVREEFGKPRMRELLQRYHGERTDTLVMSWVNNWLSAESRQWNAEEFLPKIRCPVLAIQGDQDHFGSYGQLESIRKKTNGRSEILYLHGCGHIPHQQAKEQVLEAMEAFIRKIETINQKRK